MVEASVWGASTRSIFSIAFRRLWARDAVEALASELAFATEVDGGIGRGAEHESRRVLRACQGRQPERLEGGMAQRWRLEHHRGQGTQKLALGRATFAGGQVL